MSSAPKISKEQRAEFEAELVKLESLQGGKYSDAQRALVTKIGRRMTLPQWKRVVEVLLYTKRWRPNPKEVEEACAEVLEEGAARSQRESAALKKDLEELASKPWTPVPKWVREKYPNLFGRSQLKNLDEQSPAEGELRTKGTQIPENPKDVEE